MNQITDTEFSAYVGIDWAAAKHDICVQAAEGGAREFVCISSQPEAIEARCTENGRCIRVTGPKERVSRGPGFVGAGFGT